MTDEPRKPYRVEVDAEGCAYCHSGMTWLVVGPDDVALGESWSVKDDAEDLADYLNLAYEAGLSALTARCQQLEQRIIDMEDDFAQQIDDHWHLQGGAEQFGELSEPTNADDVVSQILRVVRPQLRAAEARALQAEQARHEWKARAEKAEKERNDGNQE